MTYSIVVGSLVTLILATVTPGQSQTPFWTKSSGIDTWSSFLYTAPSGNIYAPADGKLFMSIDDGQSWTPIGEPTPETIPHGVASTPDGALFLSDGGLIWRSFDNGGSWTPMQGYTNPWITVSARGTVLATFDRGSVLRKTLKSKRFSRRYIPPVSAHKTYMVYSIAATDDGMIYGTIGPGEIFLSRNDGAMWRRIRAQEINIDVFWTVFKGVGSEVFAGTSQPGPNVLYRSTDQGQSWTKVFEHEQEHRHTFPYISQQAVVSDGNGRIAVGLRNDGVFLSTDFGLHWTKQNDGLPSRLGYSADSFYVTECLQLTPDGHLLVGTDDGVYRSTMPFTAHSPRSHALIESNERPDIFSLEQNYPNPFNPSTTITFELADEAVVSLRVINTLGEEVAIPIDHQALEPGQHVVDFIGTGMASGVYFYEFTAVHPLTSLIRFKDMKKFVFLK